MNTKVINEVFTEIGAGKFDMAGSKLSDSFSATVLGKKISKTEYLHTYRSLLQGIPDLKLDLKDLKEDGTKVKARLTLSGTHSKSIPALMNGWHEITATGKKIDGLVSDLEITLKDDRIEEIRNVDANKGMLVGLLGKLGLDYTKLQVN